MLSAILLDALDCRWGFCARRVCRTWRAVIDDGARRERKALGRDHLPMSHRVLASAVLNMYAAALNETPNHLIAFCLANAGYTRDPYVDRGARCHGRRRPTNKRDILLAFVASKRGEWIDYAIDSLSHEAPTQQQATSGPVEPRDNTNGKMDKTRRLKPHWRALVQNLVHAGQLERGLSVGDRTGTRSTDAANGNNNDRGESDVDDGGGDVDGDSGADEVFYRRLGDIVARQDDASLVRTLDARIKGFESGRHVDPIKAIACDCVNVLHAIDPPAGVFWRSDHNVPVRACRIAIFWHEAGRVDAVRVIGLFQREATPATAAECAPAAARAAVAHGCTRVLDLLASHKHTRGAVSCTRLDMLCRRAAAACNPHGFAWCVRALHDIGRSVNAVDAATDAVMGPWRENEPCVAWDTHKAVVFLNWLHAFDGAALCTPAAVAEIVHCATLPRRPTSDNDRRAHAYAIAHCMASLVGRTQQGNLPDMEDGPDQ